MGETCGAAMAMQSRGILELMDAEKEADKLVKNARKSKCGMRAWCAMTSLCLAVEPSVLVSKSD